MNYFLINLKVKFLYTSPRDGSEHTGVVWCLLWRKLLLNKWEIFNNLYAIVLKNYLEKKNLMDKSQKENQIIGRSNGPRKGQVCLLYLKSRNEKNLGRCWQIFLFLWKIVAILFWCFLFFQLNGDSICRIGGQIL